MSEVTASPKKLTVNQKALAEKTIKIKYNGLIEALKTTATLVEQQNQPLPAYPAYKKAGTGNYLAGSYQTYDSFQFPKGTIVSEEMQAALNAATAAHHALESAVSALDSLVASENAKIADENKARKAKVQEAQNAKGRVAQTLASQRDDAILNVAFQGEDAAMLEILQAIPGPAEIMEQMRAANFELSQALPTVTGIGSKSPKVLSGSAEVSIKITQDE